MSITLYHDVPSTNSDRVKIALAEKGLSWEGVRISLAKREQKNPEFLKLNPYGKIPVLVEDGKILFESCIINEYLDEKYPEPPLMPKDHWARGRARILVDYAINYLHEPYWALRGEIMMKKNEAERDQKIIEERRAELLHKLEYLELELGDKPYMLGEFSLVDIDIFPRFPRMESFGVIPSSSLPRLSAWYERMKQRPSVRAIL
jgi:glutathione S-transferase